MKDPDHKTLSVIESLRRRQALAELVRLLPARLQGPLVELYGRAYPKSIDGLPSSASEEATFLSELRRTLNHATLDGSLDRRAFLQIAGLIATAGLAHLIFPGSAAAAGYYNLGAFWKKRSTTALAPSGYPANSGSDPYWDYVVLLMNMDTYSGGPTTLFADDSNVGKTPTITGTPYIDSTASTSSPYSGRTGSAHFNATPDYLQFAASSDYSFTGDFTVEVWVRPDVLAGDYRMIFSTASDNGQFNFSNGGTSATLEFYTSGGMFASSALSWTLGQWYHLAVSRSGSSIKIFRNGTSVATGTYSGTVGSASTALSIGYRSATTSAHPFNGNMADLRIYNGVAKYTADFTAPTSPIGLGVANDKYWGYCVLACPFENSLKEMSGKAFSRSGSPQISTSQKKFGNASASFDGSSYLQTPDCTDFDFANIDFTIECWVYLNAGTSAHTFVTQNSSANDFSWRFGTRYGTPNSGVQKLHLQRSGYMGAVGTAALPTGTWTHVAVSVSGTTIRFFINGVQDTIQTTPSYSDCMANSSNPLRIGYDTEGQLNGYIDSLRITKGYARYTSNFTPPTASFPVGKDETVDPFWNYNVLAMSMDDLNDSTGRHVFTNGNSVTNNTSTKKFGTASASFNGSNQYLTTADSTDWTLGSDNFTLECWFKRGTTGANGYLCGQWGSSGASSDYPMALSIGATDYPSTTICTSGTSYSATSSVKILDTSSWHHFAGVRSGNTLYTFIDGIMVGSVSVSGVTAVDSSNNFSIGRIGEYNGNYFNGFIDDLRFTKGIARYTQNFTPPTRAFATTPLSTSTDYDPFFSNVVLLMKMDGTNGSTTFTDSSSSAKTFTNNGGAALSTSVYKYGTASGSFNGSTQFLEVATSSDFAFGTGAFTIEFWMYPTTVNSTYRRIIGSTISDWSGSMFNIRLNDSNVLEFTISGDSYIVGSTVISANTWYHVTGVFNGTEMSLYVNGVPENSAVASGVNVTDTTCYIGGHGSMDDEYFAGYLDEIRITKGVARYSVPSVSPTPFAPPRTSLPTSVGIVTSGLVALLDAGDAGSYDGSSQTWKNICVSPADGASTNTLDPNKKTAEITLSNNNLTVTGYSGNGYGTVLSRAPLGSGKYYWEVYVDAVGYNGSQAVGICPALGSYAIHTQLGDTGKGYGYSTDGSLLSNGSSTGSWASAWSTGDVIGIAVDMSSGKMWFSRNGTWLNSGNPATGANPAISGIGGTHYPAITVYVNSQVRTFRPSSSTWSYSAPSGFTEPPSSSAAYDFYRGSSSSSESSDPTFVGVPGGRSFNDYFGVNGSQCFTLANSNTNFINSMHKSGAEFTIITAIWFGSLSTNNQRFFSTDYNGSWSAGVSLVAIPTTNSFYFMVRNDSTAIKTVTYDYILGTNQWMIIGVSQRQDTSAFVSVNGNVKTYDGTYSSPSTSNSTKLCLLTNSNYSSNEFLMNGGRMALLGMWNRALSQSEFTQTFNALRSRFGI